MPNSNPNPTLWLCWLHIFLITFSPSTLSLASLLLNDHQYISSIKSFYLLWIFKLSILKLLNRWNCSLTIKLPPPTLIMPIMPHLPMSSSKIHSWYLQEAHRRPSQATSLWKALPVNLGTVAKKPGRTKKLQLHQVLVKSTSKISHSLILHMFISVT